MNDWYVCGRDCISLIAYGSGQNLLDVQIL